MNLTSTYTVEDLPGLDCGLCGMRSCEELALRLPSSPELIKRCIYLSEDRFEARQVATENRTNPLTNAVVASPIAGPVPSMGAQPSLAACAVCASSSVFKLELCLCIHRIIQVSSAAAESMARPSKICSALP